MRIVIIGAMDAEVAKYINMYEVKKVKDKEIYCTKDKNIIIAKSGIGKVNSAIMTQYIIDKYAPDVIISSGCAGSLQSGLDVLDVVIPPYVTYHDFLPERVMKYSTPNEGKISTDAKLVKMFESVISQMKDVKYIETPICSGDCYVTDAKTAKEIVDRTGALVVDMESASIGHTASVNNVQFIVIRTISDFANGSDDFEEKASHHSSKIIYKCIENLNLENAK